MKSVFTKEAKIGLVTIVSLALLYLGINYLKGINLFQPVNHYYVSFSNVKGVTISSPVFVDGFKVGLSQGRMSDQGLQTTQDRVDLRQKVLNAWQDLLLYGLHHILFHSSLERRTRLQKVIHVSVQMDMQLSSA